jgi:putative transposase
MLLQSRAEICPVLAEARIDRVQVRQRPRLLSDNGPGYASGELRKLLEPKKTEHTGGAPYHPMAQDMIERYHRSMKKLILLQNRAFPWDLEREIARFAEYYNHQRTMSDRTI